MNCFCWTTAHSGPLSPPFTIPLKNYFIVGTSLFLSCIFYFFISREEEEVAKLPFVVEAAAAAVVTSESQNTL